MNPFKSETNDSPKRSTAQTFDIAKSFFLNKFINDFILCFFHQIFMNIDSITTIVELISWEKFWSKIVPLSPYTPQCCLWAKAHTFFGYQINYKIEWGEKGGDKHCKLIFFPTFISTIVSNFFRLFLFYGKFTSTFFHDLVLIMLDIL